MAVQSIDIATNTKKKIVLHSIKNENNFITIQINEMILDHPDNTQNISKLLIVGRQTRKEYAFELQKAFIKEEGKISGVSISINEIESDLLHEEVWDLYLQVSSDDVEVKRYRVKSNSAYLELLYTPIKEEKVLVPYTTDKGNVSLKIQEPSIITRVEELSLNSDSKSLFLSGYVTYPFIETQIAGLKNGIILKSKDETVIKKFDTTNVERPDLFAEIGNEKSNLAGFKAKINLDDLIAEDLSYSFHIQISYKVAGIEKTMESSSIKLIPFKKSVGQRVIINTVSGKRKLTIRPRKKSRVVALTISSYSLMRELKGKVRRLATRIKRHRLTKKAYQKTFKLIGYLPKDKNLVMFESFLGKQYSCNPRAIYEYLKENHPQYKMYWSIDPRYIHNFADKDIQYIKRFSVKWLFLMARAHYWVINSRMPLWIPKPRNTKYLQTWHGTPLKKLAMDIDEVHMPGTSTEKYKRNFYKESRNWDYLISPNAYSTEIFKSAFMFDKEMIESGYPRNDYLHLSNNEETIRNFKEKYLLPVNKKIVIYAPTWRDDQFYGKGRYKFDLDLDLALMREKLGEDYVVILRMHYLVSENFDLGPHEGFAYDFSNHEDIRELYMISDILITDYSSVFFDYANLGRPIIFYVYDIDKYRDSLRGFYFDLEQDAPGPLVKTTDKVIESIKEIESENFVVPENFQRFYEKFCYLESGQSAKRVVERVFK
jgi:CDP-glycerol glycerophosphotransferase